MIVSNGGLWLLISIVETLGFASTKIVISRMTRIKRNPCLGWEIVKVECKQIRDICFLKFGNTLKTKNQFPVFTVLSNLRKQISLICLLSILKISQLKHWFRFILVTLYK
jgi:hypothetical protein